MSTLATSLTTGTTTPATGAPSTGTKKKVRKKKKNRGSNVPLPSGTGSYTSPSLTGRANPQTTPIPKGGTTALNITPAQKPLLDNSAFASLFQKDHPYHFKTVIENVDLNGENFKLIMRVPSPKPIEQMTDDEKEAFKWEVQKNIKLFIEDFKRNCSSKLNPEEGCLIAFSPEGYHVLPRKTQFDPIHQSIEDYALTDLGKKEILESVKKDAAAELSNTFSSGNLEAYKKTQTSPVLKTLRESAQTSDGPFVLTNLNNPNNRCFFNSPFMQLANVIGKYCEVDELKPEFFKKGESNPLYKALNGYLHHHKSKKAKGKFSLNGLEKELGTKQDDADVAWRIFEKQFELDKVPKDSPLAQLFANTIILQSPTYNNSPQSLEDLVNQAYNQKAPASSHPDFLTVYVPRTPYTAENRKSLGESERRALIRYIQTHQARVEIDKKELRTAIEKKDSSSVLLGLLQDIPANYQILYDGIKQLNKQLNFGQKEENALLAQLTRINNLAQIADQQRGPLIHSTEDAQILINAETIIADDKLWDIACGILTEAERKDLQKSLILSVAKDETPLSVGDTVTLKSASGTKTTYTVESFSSHSGTAQDGHYTTYVKSGSGYLKYDDKASETAGVQATDAKLKAQTAPLYFLVKQNLKPKVAEDSESTPASQSINQQVQDPKKIGPINVETEEGTLAGTKGCALISPTDIHLIQRHPEIAEAEKEIETQVSTAKKTAANHWYRLGRRDQITYSHGGGLLNSLPDVEITPASSSHEGIFHVPMWNYTDIPPSASSSMQKKLEYQEPIANSIQNVVVASLTKAKDMGKQKIAFSIATFAPFCPKDMDPLIIERAIHRGIERFAKENTNFVGIGEFNVKIIRSKDAPPPVSSKTSPPIPAPKQTPNLSSAEQTPPSQPPQIKTPIDWFHHLEPQREATQVLASNPNIDYRWAPLSIQAPPPSTSKQLIEERGKLHKALLGSEQDIVINFIPTPDSERHPGVFYFNPSEITKNYNWQTIRDHVEEIAQKFPQKKLHLVLPKSTVLPSTATASGTLSWLWNGATRLVRRPKVDSFSASDIMKSPILVA